MNIAGNAAHAGEIERLGKWIPQHQQAHATGSKDRILEYRDGKPVWEGKPILPGDPIPEM